MIRFKKLCNNIRVFFFFFFFVFFFWRQHIQFPSEIKRKWEKEMHDWKY